MEISETAKEVVVSQTKDAAAVVSLKEDASAVAAVGEPALDLTKKKPAPPAVSYFKLYRYCLPPLWALWMPRETFLGTMEPVNPADDLAVCCVPLARLKHF